MAYGKLERLTQNMFKNTVARPVKNLTTGVKFLADCTADHQITVQDFDSGKLKPHDIIETTDRKLYIADNGSSALGSGLSVFPACPVRHFVKVYRFIQSQKDAFGRSSDELLLVRDDLPICLEDGGWYCQAGIVKQGDLLEYEQGDRRLVQDSGYWDKFNDRLVTLEQL